MCKKTLPLVNFSHQPDLFGNVSASVSVSRLHDVLENFIFAFQHGPVVSSAREKGSVDLVALFNDFPVKKNDLEGG